jgi:hypothetical protein
VDTISDALRQRVMGNGVIIIPHHKFSNHFAEIAEREKFSLTYGITFKPNFNNFRPAILYLRNMHARV